VEVAVVVDIVVVEEVISPEVAEETSDPFATALDLRKGQSHAHHKAALLAHRKATLPAHRKADHPTDCPVTSLALGARGGPPARSSKFRIARPT
jgi:hypothetical protein